MPIKRLIDPRRMRKALPRGFGVPRQAFSWGMQIFERLRSEHGYTGSRSILHDFIATVRPVRHQAYFKLAFEPGDCMQIDWGTHGLMRIGDCTRKLHYFGPDQNQASDPTASQR